MSLKFYVVGRERRRTNPPTKAPRTERRAAERGEAHYIGIRDRRVSRRHAEIYVVNGRIFLRDLGSKNGTFVLDHGRVLRLTEGYIRPGQLVSFGGCLRRVSKLISEANATSEPDDAGQPEDETSARGVSWPRDGEPCPD